MNLEFYTFILFHENNLTIPTATFCTYNKTPLTPIKIQWLLATRLAKLGCPITRKKPLFIDIQTPHDQQLKAHETHKLGLLIQDKTKY